MARADSGKAQIKELRTSLSTYAYVRSQTADTAAAECKLHHFEDGTSATVADMRRELQAAHDLSESDVLARFRKLQRHVCCRSMTRHAHVLTLPPQTLTSHTLTC